MILIVDDNPENIYSLKKLLESKDFEVDTAPSGEEALKKVLKNTNALIILDVQMPGMDGFEVADALSGFSKTKETPIIFLSAVNTEKRFIAKGYASGALDYVTKPIDPDILMLKVKTFCRLHEQTLALRRIQKELEQEVDRRKEAQRALESKFDNLHEILESIPQIAFTINRAGKVDFVNRKWYQYSSDSKEFPQVHPDDVHVKDQLIRSLIAECPFEMEVRIKEIGGEKYRFHLLRVVPIVVDDAIVNWVGTFTDIHTQKQIEKEKDEFLSIASHELKTPLTSIKAYMQLLDRKLAAGGGSTEANYVSRVSSQVEKLNSLISDLLDISKIENGKLKITKKPFNLEQLIQNAVDTIIQTNEGSGMQLIRKGDPVDFTMLGDAIRIEQVLINFLTNAFKYGAGTEQVFVETLVGEGFVTIRVTDYGIGIPRHKQKDVFEKFYRVEETSLKFQGLGIGLYICSEIIRQHQGTIGVESEVGKGTTFYFSLPMEPSDNR